MREGAGKVLEERRKERNRDIEGEQRKKGRRERKKRK